MMEGYLRIQSTVYFLLLFYYKNDDILYYNLLSLGANGVRSGLGAFLSRA